MVFNQRFVTQVAIKALAALWLAFIAMFVLTVVRESWSSAFSSIYFIGFILLSLVLPLFVGTYEVESAETSRR